MNDLQTEALLPTIVGDSHYAIPQTLPIPLLCEVTLAHPDGGPAQTVAHYVGAWLMPYGTPLLVTDLGLLEPTALAAENDRDLLRYTVRIQQAQPGAGLLVPTLGGL